MRLPFQCSRMLIEWLKNSPEVLDSKVEPSVALIIDHFCDVEATDGHAAVILAVVLSLVERAKGEGAIDEIVELAKLLALRREV